MKKLIIGLKDNRQVYVFVALGIALILFPNAMGIAAPYVIGIVQLLYGILNVIISIRYPDASVSTGSGVISIVIGGILLVQKESSIAILGVVWAIISLYEAAKEIDEFRKEKKIGVVSLISVVLSIVLAVLLMVNPFAHFYTHVRILGLEIIAAAMVKAKKDWEEKRKQG